MANIFSLTISQTFKCLFITSHTNAFGFTSLLSFQSREAENLKCKHTRINRFRLDKPNFYISVLLKQLISQISKSNLFVKRVIQGQNSFKKSGFFRIIFTGTIWRKVTLLPDYWRYLRGKNKECRWRHWNCSVRISWKLEGIKTVIRSSK